MSVKINIPERSKLFNYLINAFAERFVGFMVGMWASGLVSFFFETRNIKNLWGLRAHKTIVTKSSYEELEWWVALIVGFIAYEAFNYFLVDKLLTYLPEDWLKNKEKAE